MNDHTDRSSNTTALKWVTPVAAFFLAVVFFVFIYGIDKYEEKTAHARVVANNLWNFNMEGVNAYLSLAAESYNYKSLVVTDSNGHVFWQIPNRELKGLTKNLVRIHLIPERKLSAKVTYEGKTIGYVETVWVQTTLFMKANVFFGLLLILAVIFLYIRILEEKPPLKTASSTGPGNLKIQTTPSNRKLSRGPVSRKPCGKARKSTVSSPKISTMSSGPWT